MDFKKIAILGAGAVGCYILWGLSNKEDIDISVIASGKRKEKLRVKVLLSMTSYTGLKSKLRQKHTGRIW